MSSNDGLDWACTVESGSDQRYGWTAVFCSPLFNILTERKQNKKLMLQHSPLERGRTGKGDKNCALFNVKTLETIICSPQQVAIDTWRENILIVEVRGT